MTQWLGDAYASSTAWDHLVDLADIGNRMGGTEGEWEGIERTRERLEATGARDVRVEEFPLQGWERGDSSLDAPGESFDPIALPRSPEGDVSGELLDLGYGLPEDFEEHDIEGKVVVVRSDVPEYYDRYIHRNEKYYYAVDGDAAAFVYRNHVEGQLPPTGAVGTDEAPIGDIPAIGISSEDGARLTRRHDGAEVSVSVTADIYDAESANVHAEFGPETDEQVVITCHVDGHDIAEGAMDNGAGTAVLVGAAEAVAAREEELDTRVHFVACGSEEVGLVGSGVLAEELDNDSVKAVLNNDGVGRGRTMNLVTQHFDVFEEIADATAERFNTTVETAPRVSPHSDHWPFVKRGIPGCQVRSVTQGVGRGWGHTHADTLDKVDPRDIREHVILLTDLIVEIADDEVETEHVTPEFIEGKLEDENKAKGMKVTGTWPIRPN